MPMIGDMDTTKNEPVWLTRAEAAERLRLHPQSVDRYVRGGKLPKYKLDGSKTVRFRAADVDALVIPCGADEDGEDQ